MPGRKSSSGGDKSQQKTPIFTIDEVSDVSGEALPDPDTVTNQLTASNSVTPQLAMDSRRARRQEKQLRFALPTPLFPCTNLTSFILRQSMSGTHLSAQAGDKPDSQILSSVEEFVRQVVGLSNLRVQISPTSSPYS